MESSVDSRGIRTALIAVLIVVLIGAAFVGAMYFRPWLNPKEQAEWAHGLQLPGSVAGVSTVGDWRRGFLDRGASTVFTMASAELKTFVTSLTIDASLTTHIPGNRVYHVGLKKPWGPNQQAKVYNCRSSTGDWLHVRVYELSSGRSAVHLYTDWN